MEIDVVNMVGLSFVKLWFLLLLTVFLLSRSRNTSAATLHALLVLVLLSLAILPLLASRVPGLHLHLLPSDFTLGLYWSYHQDAASRTFTLIGGGYLVCVMFLWLRRLMQIRQVFSLVKNARALAVSSHGRLLSQLSSRLAIKRRIRLRYSDQISSPLTLGTFRPWILLPRESLLWDEHRLRRFLLHELAHVARCDWFVKQLAYCVIAFFWILPPAWKALKKLEWLAELACDDVVVAFEGRRSDYAHDLLDMSASQMFMGAVALTESHNHYERIAAVLDGGRIRDKNPLKFWLHALVFLLVMFAVSGFQLVRRAEIKEVGHYALHPLVIPRAVNDSAGVKAGTDKEIFADDEHVRAHPPELPLSPIQLGIGETFTPVVTLDRAWNTAVAEKNPDLVQPLVKILPEYPYRALRRAREGVVEVAFSILPNGETAQIEIIRAEPQGIFDKAAVDAIRQYRYAPRERTIHGLSEVFEFRLLEDAN